MALVFLSAGHGGADPGAIGGGIYEKNANLDVMLACRDELVVNGISVATSRTRDENDPVGEEVREANASGAVVAVSYHENAGGGHGSESYYYEGDIKGKRLAELMEEASKSLGQTSRGVKKGNGLCFVRETRMTAALVETAFLDSDDVQDIDTLAERQAFGRAYAHAIMTWLEEYGYINGAPAPAPAPNPAPAPESSSTEGLFFIRVKTDLNIRKGPGTNYAVTGVIRDRLKYTIVETATASDGGTWGRLRSGAGWINVSPEYVDRV